MHQQPIRLTQADIDDYFTLRDKMEARCSAIYRVARDVGVAKLDYPTCRGFYLVNGRRDISIHFTEYGSPSGGWATPTPPDQDDMLFIPTSYMLDEDDTAIRIYFEKKKAEADAVTAKQRLEAEHRHRLQRRQEFHRLSAEIQAEDAELLRQSGKKDGKTK